MVCGVYPTSGKCGRGPSVSPSVPPYKAPHKPQEAVGIFGVCVDYADDGPVGAVLGPLMIRLMIDLASG